MKACGANASVDMISLLLERGADINAVAQVIYIYMYSRIYYVCVLVCLYM